MLADGMNVKKEGSPKSYPPRYSVWAAFFIGGMILCHSLVHHFGNSDPVNIITWDVYGYYAYLPASITYGDVHEYAFVNDHFDQYAISHNLYQIASVNDQYKAPIYTIGMAVIWFPAYLFASLIAWLVPSFTNDGLSPPFQWAVIATSWFFVALGLYYLRKTLLHFVSETVSAVTLLILFLGTNYYHYAVFEPGMSHSYLMSLYGVLMYYTVRWHQKPKTSTTIAIGVSVAMLCLARPSEGVSLLIPLLFGVISWAGLKGKLALIFQHWPQVIVLALTGISIVLIQVLYWKWSADVWFYNGYAAEHHFDWLAPHIREGFFSYRKGWLLYTPVLVLAIFGLLNLLTQPFRSNPPKIANWSTSVLAFFLLNTYVVLSWHMWWYASSFGSRALIQSYAVLAIPLAAFLAWSFKRKWLGILIVGFAVSVLGLNHFQDWQYRNRILTFDNMTRSFYWNAWGSTTFDPNAFFLLDNDEWLPNRSEYTAKSILHFDAKSDTTSFLTKIKKVGLTAVEQGPTQQYAAAQRLTIPNAQEAEHLSGRWVEVSAKVQMSSTLFDNGKNAKLVLSIARGSETLYWRGVNMQRYRPADEWFDVKFQLQLPEGLKSGDTFTFVSWNTSPDTMYINRMDVSVLIEG